MITTAITWYLTFASAYGGSAAMSSLSSCLEAAAAEYRINGPQFQDAKGECRSDDGDHVRFTVETINALIAAHRVIPISGRPQDHE